MNVSAWGLRHAQNAIGGLGTLTRNPVAAAMTIAVIGIALSLPAALGVLVQSGRSVAAGMADVRDFSVYVAPAVPADRAQALAREISAMPSVAAARLVTATEGLAEMRAQPAFGELVAALVDNPLPHAIVVRPEDGASADEVARLADELRRAPGVELVRVDTEWLQRLQAILDLLRQVVWITSILLLAGVVIIVGNTIRLDIQNRADEIEVAKLLGATDGFVRRPFLYLGLWYGLLGGLLALLILAVSLGLLSGPVRRLADLYGSAFALQGPGLRLSLLVLVGGILAGWSGAWTAVARHLSSIQPKA